MNTFFLFFQGGLGALGQFLPVILIIGVFYVLLIRPQQKRQRELQETIAGLKVGDRVVTSGGIKGRITTVKESSFVIISAEKSTLEVAKGSIAGVDSEQEKA